MTQYEIPLSPQAQSFSITMAGVQYQITLKWCLATNTWIIDLFDSNGNAIVSSVPVVANTDLFEPFGYLNLGGKLIAQTDNALDVPPTYDDLGTTGHIYFVTP